MDRDLRLRDRGKGAQALGVLAAALVIAGCGGGEHRLTTHRLRTHRLTIGADRMYGVYYSPRDTGRRPAVITIGGAGGGLTTGRVAKALAVKGYPALSLAYMGVTGLPGRDDDIDVDYFARAARWLARQPGVDPQRIVIMGGSFGGEAALFAASQFGQLFHGAIGLVPRAYLDPGWRLHGERMPIGADIPISRIRGPILVAGAGRDQVWESADAARQIARTLRDARFPYAHTTIVYAKAGHGIGGAITYPPLWRRVLRFLRAL